RRGIGPGDTVAAVLPNVPAMLEAHFGVPMAGAVLNTINTRLDARTIGYILEHGEAKVLLTDREYAGTVGPALEKLRRKPLVVDVGGDGDDRYARRPPPRRSAARVPADRARARDPHVRRADGAHDADPDAPRPADHVRAGRRARDRWLLAAGQGHPRDERDGLQRHAPLRPHRGARALDALRAPGGVGEARAGRARREAGATGRALSDARRPDGRRPQDAPAGA